MSTKIDFDAFEVDNNEFVKTKNELSEVTEVLNLKENLFLKKIKEDKDLSQYKEEIEELLGRKTTLTKQLKEVLVETNKGEDFKELFSNFYFTFSFSQSSSMKFDASAFKQANPELYNQYLVKKPIVRALIKEKKNVNKSR